MTQRTILAGPNPAIVIKAGAHLVVRGVEGEQVTATSADKWGLKIEKHSAAEFARARLAMGEAVIFDWHFKNPLKDKSGDEDVLEVQLGGSGEVLVPVGATVKVYAGRDIFLEDVTSRVDVYAGTKVKLRDIALLGNASAGSAMDIECQRLTEGDHEYSAGGDLRFYAQELDSLRLRVKDIGGYWEATVGSAGRTIYLKSGGDVTFVTANPVNALPPDYLLGHIEKPVEDRG